MTEKLTYEQIARLLHLPEAFAPYRDGVPDAMTGDGFSFPQLEEGIAFLEMPPDLAVELRLAFEEVLSQPAMRALLRIARAAIWSRPGQRIDWPLLPQGSVGGRLFYALVFLWILPDVLALHRGRGVAVETSRETLLDLPRWAMIACRRHGAFATLTPRWLARAFTGTEYRLGRLQFEMRSFYLPERRVVEDVVLLPGAPILGLHIPEGRPLTDAAVEDAFAQAGVFFGQHFPEFRYQAVVCDSWLMCPALLDVLPATSNIARFQRRFEVFTNPAATDDGVLDYLFDHPASRTALPRETSLQRAVVEAMDRGKTFPDAVGIIVAETFAAAAGCTGSP